MKPQIYRLFLFILVILSVPVYAQDFKTIHDGIEYAEMTREVNGLPVRMNLMRMDLSKVRLDVVHALDAAIGTETVSSMAARHGAFAAINSGFFRLDNSIFAGDSVGVLAIDNRLLSESVKNRIALFIDNFDKTRTVVSFANLNVNSLVKIRKTSFHVSGINRERKVDELIEFTPYFHRTTLTDDDGLEVVVRKGKITEINDGKGNSQIPESGFVISASGKMREKLLPLLKLGRKVKNYKVTSFSGSTGYPNDDNRRTTKAFSRAEDIIGGVPQLIRNGKIDITWEQEGSTKSFVETRHPRTAVAKLNDGRFLMITIDGRSEASAGIGLEDLAEILLELGAVDAMNLDGGGSTTMFLDGKVVNQPSGNDGERKVSDAILVFPRKE